MSGVQPIANELQPLESSVRLSSGIRSIARVAAAVVVALGVIVLVGWASGVGVLTTLLPGLPPMKANTAVLLILGGGGLGLATASRPVPFLILLVPVALLGLVAGLTLVEYAARVDLGIDRLIASSAKPLPGAPFPGRISIPTSLALLAASLALATLGRSWRSLIASELLGLFCAVIGGLSLVGYAYDADSLASLGSGTRSSLPASIGLLALGLGIVAASRRHHLVRYFGDPGVAGQLTRRLLPTVLLVIPLGGAMEQAGVRGGLFDDRLGAVLFVTIEVLVLIAFIARFSGRTLRAESNRVAVEFARLFDIIDFLPDATFVIDADRHVIAWNRAVEEMTGVPREEILGQGDLAYSVPWYGEPRPTLVDLLWSGDEEWVEAYDNVRRQSQTLYGEVFAPLLRGGEGAYLWVTATRLLDGSGNRVGAIETVRDITERKGTEKALQEAKEAAEAGTRAKGDFLATMSHEIRTPMNGIIGSTELLLATDLTEDQQCLAGALRDSSEALLAIVNDVLDFSKIEANSLELEPIPFDLRAVFDSVCGVLRLAAAQKNLELTLSVDPRIPTSLVGDQARLRQVLTNLVSNAVKFTERGEVVVSVAMLESTDAGKARLGFEVRDTGIGISPEARSRLFKSFSQADSSMSRRFGGTGLGLAISWRLVDLMGGCLDVSSRVGEGSTFSFSIELPIDPTASLDVPRRPGNSEAESTTITPASVPLGALLLLVEDNEINRQVVGAMLCGLGVEPGGMASDGFEAVAATDATPFDLILMDCQMPGMDGFEATREIRRKEAGGRHATIVALTANATPEDRERCLAAGMDDFMSKPVRLATLRETLDRWLAPARASTEVWPAAADDIAQPPLGPGPVAPAAQESDGPVVLDQETLAMLRSLGEGGEDVLGPLVDLLESEAEGHLAAIEAAVERGDAQALGGIAHTLKGASRNLGAVLVGEIAAELERRGKSGSAAEAELVSQLKAALVTTSAAFREERQKPGPTTESASQPSPSRDEAA